MKDLGTTFTIRKWIYRGILALSYILLVGFTGVFAHFEDVVKKLPQSRNVQVQASPLKEEVSWWEDLKSFTLSPLFTKEERVTSLSRDQVLGDELNRIGEDFKIPKGLKKRTGFWFDIYTQYGQYEHVIHHVRFPWVVFKVVDGRSIIDSKKGA